MMRTRVFSATEVIGPVWCVARHWRCACGWAAGLVKGMRWGVSVRELCFFTGTAHADCLSMVPGRVGEVRRTLLRVGPLMFW